MRALIGLLPRLAGEFLRFVLVGFIGAASLYAVLVIAVEGLGAHPLVGSCAGNIVGSIVSYVLNRSLTFRSDRAHREALPRFLLVAASGFALNGLLMTAFVDYLDLNYLLGQALTIVILVVWHFSLNRWWTFRA